MQKRAIVVASMAHGMCGRMRCAFEHSAAVARRQVAPSVLRCTVQRLCTVCL
jgi:hypothetical protein